MLLSTYIKWIAFLDIIVQCAICMIATVIPSFSSYIFFFRNRGRERDKKSGGTFVGEQLVKVQITSPSLCQACHQHDMMIIMAHDIKSLSSQWISSITPENVRWWWNQWCSFANSKPIRNWRSKWSKWPTALWKWISAANLPSCCNWTEVSR